jgi:streptogramin lyase
MILERDIERYLVRRAIEHGGKAYKWVSPGHVGVADRIVMLPGGVVWFVELKTAAGRLSPLQKIFAADMRRMGINYIVIRSKEEVDQWFSDLTKS